MTSGRGTGWLRQLKIALLSAVGMIALRALGATWRIRSEGEPLPDSGYIIAIWHGELLPLLWVHRNRGFAPLISTHGDGEIIARVVGSLGYYPIRGSSSRGGARALLQAVRTLEEDGVAVFTTDGPRGPRRESAPGVAAAAIKARRDVRAIGCEVSRKWQLRSWDRFVIPKPFATIHVRYASVVRATPARPPDAVRAEIDQALMTVCGADA